MLARRSSSLSACQFGFSGIACDQLHPGSAHENACIRVKRNLREALLHPVPDLANDTFDESQAVLLYIVEVFLEVVIPSTQLPLHPLLDVTKCDARFPFQPYGVIDPMPHTSRHRYTSPPWYITAVRQVYDCQLVLPIAIRTQLHPLTISVTRSVAICVLLLKSTL